MLTGGVNWVEVFATLVAFAGEVASIEVLTLPTASSIWIVGGIGLVLLPVATFILQQIVGSVITGETWSLWQRIVRARQDVDSATVPVADLRDLIRQSEQAVAVIEGLRAENQYLLELLAGPRRARPIRADSLATTSRGKRPLPHGNRPMRPGRPRTSP